MTPSLLLELLPFSAWAQVEFSLFPNFLFSFSLYLHIAFIDVVCFSNPPFSASLCHSLSFSASFSLLASPFTSPSHHHPYPHSLNTLLIFYLAFNCRLSMQFSLYQIELHYIIKLISAVPLCVQMNYVRNQSKSAAAVRNSSRAQLDSPGCFGGYSHSNDNPSWLIWRAAELTVSILIRFWMRLWDIYIAINKCHNRQP